MGTGQSSSSPVVGVDLGGTKISAAVVSRAGKILGRARKRTKAHLGAAEVLARISLAVRQAAEDAETPMAKVAAVGIGAPGPLDPSSGVLLSAPNLPGWHDVPLAREISEALGIPVYVENDVNLGTLSEHVLGAGRGTKDMVGVFVGTGVGGGLILDGRLRSGARHAAGEIGHMVVAAGGPYCGCGRQGCLEAVASRTAMERDLRAGIAAGRESLLPELAGPRLKRLTSSVLARAWKGGCPLTREVVGRAQWYLGLHAASIVNLLDPEMLVYGGGMTEAMGEEFLAPIREVALQHLMPKDSAPIRLAAAKLGDDAGVLGAALLAQQRSTTE